MSAQPAAWLLLPHLRVRNANAISSPITWGFPAPTAFTGFIHALSRRIGAERGGSVRLEGAGIVCHDFAPQVSGGWEKRFALTRNPLGKDKKPAPFVEEGRAHLEVTLIAGVHGPEVAAAGEAELAALAQSITALAETQRLAGGTIEPLPAGGGAVLVQAARPGAELRALRRRLLPGFALVERSDRLRDHVAELRGTKPEATSLDALLDLCALHWDCETRETASGAQQVEWHIRRRPGWLVPLPVGYRALSPLHAPGTVLNARDRETPVRFVESVYTIGEWIGAHRAKRLDALLWHDEADPGAGLYRCINRYTSVGD
jgi:CRISPR-associated protein Csy2